MRLYEVFVQWLFCENPRLPKPTARALPQEAIPPSRSQRRSRRVLTCGRGRRCHTRFSEENRMHLICVTGSKFHTYDRLMSVISQNNAQKRT
jgi:hypothetical protein